MQVACTPSQANHGVAVRLTGQSRPGHLGLFRLLGLPEHPQICRAARSEKQFSGSSKQRQKVKEKGSKGQ